MTVDPAWRDAVRAACDPVFEAADCGFEWNGHGAFSSDHPTMLWEADPVRFAERYPDSGIVGSYGEQWPPPCLDYWVYVDPQAMTASLSVEGWRGAAPVIELTGEAAVDGPAIARAFVEILGVGAAGKHS